MTKSTNISADYTIEEELTQLRLLAENHIKIAKQIENVTLLTLASTFASRIKTLQFRIFRNYGRFD